MALLVLHHVSDDLLCDCGLSGGALLDQEVVNAKELKADQMSTAFSFSYESLQRAGLSMFKGVDAWVDQVRQRNRIKHCFPCIAVEL